MKGNDTLFFTIMKLEMAVQRKRGIGVFPESCKSAKTNAIL